MIRKKFADESGQSIILIALLMAALLAMLGLVLDGGEAYLTRRDAQNASDAGAFAGGQALRSNSPSDAGIRNVIDQYTQANHVVNAGADVVAYYLDAFDNQINTGQVGALGYVPSNATGVVVTSSISVQTFFIGLVTGSRSTTIPARAKVQTGQLISPGSPLVPMAVPLPISCPLDQSWSGNPSCDAFQPGVSVDLFGTNTGSGNLQWLNLGAVDPNPAAPCNENCIAQYIVGDHNPPPPAIKIGDWLYSTTGVSVNKCTNSQVPDSSIICALDYWIDKPYAESRWIVPIFQVTQNPNGNNLEYQVIAFGAFHPTGYNFGNGSGWSRNFAPNETCIDPFTLLPADQNTKCIKGTFQGYVTPPGEVDPTKQCNVNALNVCGIQLEE